MENLPVLPSTNKSSVKGRYKEFQVASNGKFCSKSNFKSSSGTNFIWKNIQLVSKKKEDEYAGLFLTEFEKKRLEEILNDDLKDKVKSNSNQHDLNTPVNAYKLNRQSELCLREIDMKLQPIIPAPEETIKKLVQNCQNSSTSITKKLQSNQGTSLKKSTSKLHLTSEDQDNTLHKTVIHEEVLQSLLQDIKKSMPLFQYRF